MNSKFLAVLWVVIYGVIGLLVLSSIALLEDSMGLPRNLLPALGQFVLFVGIAVAFCSWGMEAAAKEDRGIVFLRILLAAGPFLLPIGVLWVVYYGFEAIPRNLFLALFFTWGPVALIWVQLSNPFARHWLYQRAFDLDRVQIAERRLSWPLQQDDYDETDIHVSPTQYFGLLALLSAVMFIIIETIVGELVSGFMATSGYLNASIVALCVAAIIYPVHSVASSHFEIRRTLEFSRSSDTIDGVHKEILRGIGSLLRVFLLRYWYFSVPLLVLAGAVSKVIVRSIFPLN